MTAEQFADRHIGPGPDDERRMLETVGYSRVDELMDAAIPEVIRWHGALDLPAPAGEREALAELHRRGTLGAPTVVAVQDGAEWIQGFLDLHLPGATRVLDFAHAAGYLGRAAQEAFGPGTAEAGAWLEAWRHELTHGGRAPEPAWARDGEASRALGHVHGAIVRAARPRRRPSCRPRT